MKESLRSSVPLRTRLFLSIGLVVVLSIGATFGVGLWLTFRSVERANLDDLSHQADLLAEREREALLPFAHLGPLRPFLAKQKEKIEVVDLRRPTPFLSDEERAAVRAGRPVKGRVSVEGSDYLFAAREVGGKGFVLLRPARLSSADWWPFLQGLLIAGGIGAALAALVAFMIARVIARPVRRVAEASRSLAEGVSPDPVPIEGSAELASLAASFNHMNRELARARESERNFFLSVSHELKTPLAAIRGYAEGIEDGAFDPDEAAQTIREEARRLERLVHDLLDLARMNRAEFAVHRRPIDLAEVGREAVRRYEPEARACGVELEAVCSDPAPAEGDADRVLQVVSNLVENALRSTPAGGSVRVRAEPGRLAVEDTGTGLRPEDLPHAFERFYLYDRSRDGRRIGTGLGLAIVKELTEKMGGSVEVESVPGKGTTFLVRLPGARDAAPIREAATSGRFPVSR